MNKVTTVMLALALVGAAPPDLGGTWKLVVLPFGNDEFLIVDLKSSDGMLTGKVPSTQPMLGERSVEGSFSEEAISLEFPGKGVALAFKGKLASDGKILGVLKYSSTRYPARLERTDAEKVSALASSAIRLKVSEASRLPDVKARAEKLIALIKENAGQPYNATAYSALLSIADRAGLTEAVVQGHVEDWLRDAALYGAEWVTETRTRALKALQGKKSFAALSTDLAMAAESALAADSPLELRASIGEMLGRSARLSGKTELADATDAKVKVLQTRLDDEYHKTFPPFKPVVFTGRKDPKANRAIVMEIFTGAECPPCVAADVGFDALLKSYKPSEFIGLQYHLHIPGPDPLTNQDSVARQKYYGSEVRGTPSTFFDGKRAGGSGGLMQHAEAKYEEYRAVVDPSLETTASAEITLSAIRSGDELKINAQAISKESSKDSKPRLRLILVEKAVRYPGGNKLRFHHNVVRAFPGGVEGKALDQGKATVEIAMNLLEVRKAQQDYVERFPDDTGRAFPHPLPSIALEDLAVVALVQDDSDHAIWQGVMTPVRILNP